MLILKDKLKDKEMKVMQNSQNNFVEDKQFKYLPQSYNNQDDMSVLCA